MRRWSPAILLNSPSDKFLACAMLSKSQYLVSGDKHLLKLGTFLETAIVRLFLYYYVNFKERS